MPITNGIAELKCAPRRRHKQPRLADPFGLAEARCYAAIAMKAADGRLAPDLSAISSQTSGRSLTTVAIISSRRAMHGWRKP